MKVKDWFLDFGRGAALGTGILPGVSVGTVGIIVNVYDKLLNSISGLLKKFWVSFLALLPIALGTVISAVILLWGYSHLKDYAPFEIIALLAGLILGGLPIIVKEIPWKELKAADFVRISVGFVIAAGIGIVSALAGKFNWFDFGAAFMAPNENPYIYVVTFFIGFVAAVACLLPGISGSMVLFIFGLYNPVVALYSGPDSMIHNHERVGTGIILTLILFVGVVVGLIAFAKIMHNLMEKHHQGTFTTVFGLILGSFVSMFINKDTLPYYEGGNPWWHYVLGAALLICGCVLMLFLVKKKMSAQKAAEETNAEDSGTN
jgi:putative membrane protein